MTPPASTLDATAAMFDLYPEVADVHLADGVLELVCRPEHDGVPPAVSRALGARGHTVRDVSTQGNPPHVFVEVTR